MERSYLILILLTIFASLGLFFMPQQNQGAQQMYQIKVQFEMFKDKHGKNYKDEQLAYRFKVFKENYEMIEKHNKDSSKTYKMKINQFGDLTQDQFREQILTPNLKNMKTNIEVQAISRKLQAPPAAVDWRGKNVITPIKNQGMCGSCWSFSTTGAFEAAVAMKTQTLKCFSQQQLVDCCAYAKYGCQGCGGAWPEWAMQYVKDAGIVLESQYPYTAVQDKCKPIPTAQKILDHRKPYTMVTNSTQAVKQALATYGPLSVCVDAYRWQYYYTGVFNDCGDTQIDHAVLLVGYQEDGAWIIKNSWGTTWGEQGYIRVSTKGQSCLVKTHVIITHLV